MKQNRLYWTITTINQQPFLLAKTSNGLCYIDSNQDPFNTFKKWINKQKLTFTLKQSENHFKKTIQKLNDYFSGKTLTFNEPLDLYGTEFQQNVWQAIHKIPYGKTVTYSDIAQKINRPTSVRAVANAIGANPMLIIIPCHRIIGKDGSLTGFRAGLTMKKQLLTLERNNNQ